MQDLLQTKDTSTKLLQRIGKQLDDKKTELIKADGKIQHLEKVVIKTLKKDNNAKDQELEMLKDMIKTTNGLLKQRDTEIKALKRQKQITPLKQSPQNQNTIIYRSANRSSTMC